MRIALRAVIAAAYLLALGVFFVLAHLAAGLRVVLLSHGVRRPLADRIMIGGATAGAVLAAIIILAMCGMRVQFT